MKTFYNFQNLPQEAKGALAVIGNFDGAHKGHQFLLREAKKIAAARGLKLGVLTFEPHPKRLFRPDEPPGRITPPDVKAWRMEEAGVDFLYSIPFDWPFASLTADDFIAQVLKNGLNAAHIVVGRDFRFGQMRKGEAGDIERAGVPVTLIDAAADLSGAVYSSSRIREALRQGDIAAANEILGWEWEMRGRVVRGDQRGRRLGYPTANFPLGAMIHPAYGVYAARVNVEDEKEWRNAAINIGIRPMFEIPEAEVESYIFDFSREIYGKTLRVRPVQRLRSEAKFGNIEELKTQIGLDCKQAKEILDKAQ